MIEPGARSRRAVLLSLFGQSAEGPTSGGEAEASCDDVVARIHHEHCLGWSGSLCTVCREHCTDAIAIVFHGVRPIVDSERCTGCGECATACPAPVNAISMAARSAPVVMPTINEAPPADDWRTQLLSARRSAAPTAVNDALDRAISAAASGDQLG